MRWLWLAVLAVLLAAQAHASDNGVLGGHIGRVHVACDSYCDAGELDAAFADHGVLPGDIWSSAVSGARSFDSAGVDPTPLCVDPWTPANCDSGVAQVTHIDAACRRFEDMDGDTVDEATCMPDRVVGPTDVGVISFLANDLSPGAAGGWVANIQPQTEAAFQAMMDAYQARGVRAVVTISWPAVDPHPHVAGDKLQFSPVAAAAIQARVDAGGFHTFLNPIPYLQAYEAQYGTAALRGLYDSIGIHPHTVPNSEGHIGREIWAAEIANAAGQLAATNRDVALNPPQPSAVSASATATLVGGDTCIAPCGVYFNALATTDTNWTNEGHSLLYDWNFDDDKGETWAANGIPKDRDLEVIAGHLYTDPGTYDWTLLVSDPDGEFDTATGSITVVDPGTVFTDAQTFCFKRGNQGNYLGCPLDTDADGTCDGASAGNCIVNNDWDDAILNDCNADAGPARCLFKAGSTFDQSANMVLADLSAPNQGLIGTFGTGGAPFTVDSLGDPDLTMLTIGSRWKVTGFEYTGTETQSIGCDGTGGNFCNGTKMIETGNGREHFTIYNGIGTNLGGQCIAGQTGSQIPSEQHSFAYIQDIDCTHGTVDEEAGQFTGVNISTWTDSILYGIKINGNHTGEFPFRGSLKRGRISHWEIENTQVGRNAYQFRNAHGADVAWSIVTDNKAEVVKNIGTLFARTCWDPSCSPTASRDRYELTDMIFRRNFVYDDADQPNTDRPQNIYEIGAGRTSIDGNIYELTGATDLRHLYTRAGVPTNCTICPTDTDGLWISGETFYAPGVVNASSISLATENGTVQGTGPIGQGSEISNILLVAPNATISSLTEAPGNWASGGNLSVCASGCDLVSAEPFDGALPLAVGASTKDDFKISTFDANYSDAGVDPDSFGASKDVGGVSDGFLQYRNIDGSDSGTDVAFDIGAHEQGSMTIFGNPITTPGGNGGGGGPVASSCTDGVDCRCDILLAAYPNMAFCEDFENDRLQEPCGWQGGNNCDGSPPYGGWQDQEYGGIVNSCWTNANPGRDITNNGGCIDIAERDVASSSDIQQVPIADLVWDGDHSLVQVNRPGATHGIHGIANLTGGPHANFTYTMAIYYADSIEEQGQAWKADEFTPGRWSLSGSATNQANGGIETKLPYSARIWDTTVLPLAFTVNKGTAAVNLNAGVPTGRLKASAEFGTGPGQYEYRKGEWRCRSVVYTGWGTANGNTKHYWDGELVMDIDIDMAAAGGSGNGGLPNPAGLEQFEWNNYWNGSGSPLGYQGSNISGRIKDNVVIMPGENSVSCADIGFPP